MKKKRNKSVAAILLSLAVATAAMLAGCGESEEKPTMVELADWREYVLIRSDEAEQREVDAAVLLRKTIQETFDMSYELDTDWVKRGEEIPVGTKEILIGDTNRPESDVDIRYNDFTVEKINDRVIIRGGGPEATMAAVEWFIENCITDTLSIPEAAYTYTSEYPFDGVTIGGVPLESFAVEGAAGTEDDQLRLKQWLAEMTGRYPETDGDHSIRMTADDTIDMFDVRSVMEGSDILLSVNSGGLPMSEAIELFKRTIENRTGDDLIMNEVETVEIPGVKQLTDAQLAEWRRMTDERIKEIHNTPNMEIPDGAKVYYVSPDGDNANDGLSPEKAVKTLFRVSNLPLRQGDIVCFERGGVWRGNLSALKGVTYTAFGEGEKPRLYASPEDGADPAKWKQTETKNVWVYEAWENDVGTLVFNHGEAHAKKYLTRKNASGALISQYSSAPFSGGKDLTEDLSFYHDLENKKLYLYSEKNPGERFDSIEFCIKPNIVQVHGPGVTIDNICFMYGGAHAIGSGTTQNLTVQNCEFKWIGGSLQHYKEDGNPVRYGNAVEIYGGCDTYTVQNNYFYQIYDAAITHQVSLSESQIKAGTVLNQKNITYRGNVMEYCNYSIEYFLGNVPEDNPSRMENFLIEDNYMWYAAQGLSQQRADKNNGCHIKGWSHTNRAANYVIRNNLMIGTNDMLVDIYSNRMNPDGSDSMPSLSGNQFAATTQDQFGILRMNDNTRIGYTPDITDYVGEYSDGDTFWFMKNEN